MPPLRSELRGLLDRKIQEARDAAEDAALAALTALAVNQAEPFRTLDPEQRRLRNALRAKAQQLGGGGQTAGFQPLVEEVAYEQWHRMLFARFLAENGLLMHPSGIAVTLEECAELAPDEGEADAWMLAARYASAMLPGIFGKDDPSARVRFAPEGRDRLERILGELPSALFTADDALGWVYQFWQTKKKKEVNASGRKIGGADLAPVTQLFTEDYMVRFLLENSLGAWWAARHPESPLVKQYEYLCFRSDGTPAAGTFPGWPRRAAEVSVMDPCCGSGHFLVAAFEMLRQMRMEEEGLSETGAGDAVLRGNLFGLEIDARCTQLAAFALALAAWKAGGYRRIPIPNLACSGIAVEGQLREWTRLAGDDANLKMGLERLFHLFRSAPDLGSLIRPTATPQSGDMFSIDHSRLADVLERALAAESTQTDPVTAVFGQAAHGVARATALLGQKYTLVATNVPHIGFKKIGGRLKEICESSYPDAKMDLATVFMERCCEFLTCGGAYAVLTPQNWLFTGSYKSLRKRLLTEQTWHVVVWLGPGAFETIGGEVVKPALTVLTHALPLSGQTMFGLDVSDYHPASEKAHALRRGLPVVTTQAGQLANPDARVTLHLQRGEALLEESAISPRGIVTGDLEYWVRCFWEVLVVQGDWQLLQATVDRTRPFGGREHIINWSTSGRGMLRPGVGNLAYGHSGVAVNRMSNLACTLYTGELYDQGIAVLVPKDPELVPLLWAYCQSQEFRDAVRSLDRRLGLTPTSLLRVPFDRQRWSEESLVAGPMPKRDFGDPTQWLFDGHPIRSTEPLQVAVARLLGYHWPKQESDTLGAYADQDGIVCLPPVAGEKPAAERLRALLAAAYGDGWSPGRQEQLLGAFGFGGKGLDEWLRDGSFEQHCRLFHNRPFIWHIWDGRKDGFSALVNYHKLDAAGLDRLIYTYLGQWISARRAERDAGSPGAEGRLVAALGLQKKLEAIRDGERPYDIYVRWKPLSRQPIGWNPDLNDGVRLNIRPFVTAGVLRGRFTINWNKDRGTNPDGGERLNDRHYTNAEKQAARKAAGISA